MGYKRVNIPKDELAAMIAEGKTQDQIAAHYCCSQRTVATRVTKYGLQTREREYDFDLDQLRSMYEDLGMTSYEIAEQLGVAQQTIYSRLCTVADMRQRAPRRGRHVGPNAPGWDGGIRILDGYIRIRWLGREETLHRIIAHEIMGYDLGEGDDVHHIDRNRCNNHPDNLLVLTHAEHMRLHAELRKNPDLDQRAWLEAHRAAEQGRAA